MREDKAEAARIDAELDARDAVTAATRQAAREAARETARQVGAWGGGRGGEPVTGLDPGAAVDALADEVEDVAERPWWEDDPRFTDRFRGGRA
jgi:hypothetical protein